MQEEGDWRVHGSSLLSHQQQAAMLQRSWPTAASLPTPMEQRFWMSRTLTWTGVSPSFPISSRTTHCAPMLTWPAVPFGL